MVMFVTEGMTKGWLERVHRLGWLEADCLELSSFPKTIPIPLLEFRQPFPSSKLKPVRGNWIGCSTPGKHIGCKLTPFLIDNICKTNHNEKVYWGSLRKLLQFPFFLHFLLGITRRKEGQREKKALYSSNKSWIVNKILGSKLQAGFCSLSVVN